MKYSLESVEVDSPILHFSLHPFLPVGEINQLGDYLKDFISRRDVFLDANIIPDVLTIVDIHNLKLTVQLNLDNVPLYVIEEIVEYLGDLDYITTIPEP